MIDPGVDEICRWGVDPNDTSRIEIEPQQKHVASFAKTQRIWLEVLGDEAEASIKRNDLWFHLGVLCENSVLHLDYVFLRVSFFQAS